jgi:hypothetical protein
MSKSWRIVIIISAMIFLIGLFAYPKIQRFFEIDECLDKGGRWNYETAKCEYAFDTVKSNEVSDKNKYEKLQGYDELADEQNRKRYTISEYNTDISEIDNIERPQKSKIIDPIIDTSLFFNIWTLYPDGPHADFWIRESDFYVVDYDGNSSMPYILNQDRLVVFYNDFKKIGKILKVTKDSLIIYWKDTESPTSYVDWDK